MQIDQRINIKDIQLFEVSLPLKIPFQISGGTLYSRKSLIIELSDGQKVGYGESAPFECPFYSEETVSTAKSILKEIIFPRIIGKEVTSIEEFNNLINDNIRGNNFAKAGIETAYWDLVARKNNISLKELIEFKLKEMEVADKYLESNEYIKSGVAVGIPESMDLNELERWVDNYLQEGYNRVKIKIKPGWDLKPIARVRKLIGPDFPFWVDANSAYDLSLHLDVLKKIDQYRCLFIEQPLHHNDIIEHTRLSEQIETPLCLDESLKDARIASQVVKMGTSNIWNIKIQRIGGLYEACKIYKLAVENGVSLWGGTMPESGIGASFIIALASFKGFSYSSDVEDSNRWYKNGKDLITIKMTDRGNIYINDTIGIGDVNQKVLMKYGEHVPWGVER